MELFLIMCYLQKILPFLGLMVNFIGGSFLLFGIVTILLSIKNIMLLCVSVNIFIANLRVFSSCEAGFLLFSEESVHLHCIDDKKLYAYLQAGP